jgi:hypothetical protein
MLLGNKDETTRLATAAQQTAAVQFSVERMIAETEEIYCAAIQEHQSES